MIFNIDKLVNDDLIALRAAFVACGYDLRFVGGCVRDLLAGHEAKDIDLCTDATPDEQVAVYQANNIRYIETGIDHGTVTVLMNDVTYEITSLRLDVATDGRRATVAYTKDWLADLARRDFTINAMSLTFDGVLIDPFNGYEDLKNGIVKFVGDADTRIKEDYLRILRWFRFRGRYEDVTDKSPSYQPDYKAVIDNRLGLAQISKERVWSEIKKIVSGPNGPRMMLELHRHGCDKPIGLPNRLDWIMRAEDIHSRVQNPMVILCEMYSRPVIVSIMNQWKISNEEREFFQWYMDYDSDTDFFYMLAVKGDKREWVLDLAKAVDRDPFDLAVLADWPIPKFPVNGFDLIKLGIKPGPNYALILDHLKIDWAKSGYTATKEQLLEQVDVTQF